MSKKDTPLFDRCTNSTRGYFSYRDNTNGYVDLDDKEDDDPDLDIDLNEIRDNMIRTKMEQSDD
jgi:hypothetical protein